MSYNRLEGPDKITAREELDCVITVHFYDLQRGSLDLEVEPVFQVSRILGSQQIMLCRVLLVQNKTRDFAPVPQGTGA